MEKRRFIRVDRASNLLYWDCPNRCKQLHNISIPADLPALVVCSCGAEYAVSLISDITSTSARILIEGDIK